MLEFLSGLINDYGLVGLFTASALGSTIFIPFSVELGFPMLLNAHVSSVLIIIFASIGALVGTLLNYYIGTGGLEFAEKKLGKSKMMKAQDFMNRYGWLGITTAIALPLPLPVDPLTIFCGVAKMNIFEFSAAVLIGKIIKYSTLLGVLTIFF